MHDVSGVDGAAPVWREIMDFLHEGVVPTAPVAPAGVVRQRIAYAGGVESGRDEWFIAGTETARVSGVEARSIKPHIQSPPDGAIYAIDPDIPEARQRVVVSAHGAPRGSRVVLDDGRQARADRPVLWLPAPGRREIALVAADGRELDRVRIEVRGLRPIKK